MLTLMIKGIILSIIAILIRGTLPRYRIDQVLFLNWKLFIYILIFFYIELIFIYLFIS